MASPTTLSRRVTPSAAATSPPSRPRSATRWSTPTAPPGPLDKVRARVEATAERADGLFLTPPTYFISPEELSEYQNRLIDAFGPAV